MSSTTSVSWPFARPLSHPPALAGRPTAGPLMREWIESHCVFGEGDRAGEPVQLEPFQRYKLNHIGELLPDGRWRYRRVLDEEPKGNGKTPFLAWVSLFRLCHDASPVIPVGATSFGQADLLYGDMKACVDASDVLQERLEAYEDRIVVKGGKGRAYKVSAKGGTNDGGRPTVYAADEIHELKTPEQQKSFRTIARGIVKRKTGIVLAGSTPGPLKGEGLLWDMHAHGLRVNAGEISDPGFLFLWWGAAGEGFDRDDTAELARLLRLANPAADVFLDVDEHVRLAHTMPAYEFERYHLGRWTALLGAWLPANAWESLVDPIRQLRREAGCPDAHLYGCAPAIPHGADVVLGFDGSHNGDATGIAIVDLDGRCVSRLQLWERPVNAPQGWVIPRAEVEATLRRASELYRVREIAYDPRLYHQLFEELETDGYPLREVPQGQDMADACQRFYEATAQREICHDGDPALIRHLGNCVGKLTGTGVRVAKENPHSTRWIDLAAAAVMAVDSAAVLAPVTDVTRSIH